MNIFLYFKKYKLYLLILILLTVFFQFIFLQFKISTLNKKLTLLESKLSEHKTDTLKKLTEMHDTILKNQNLTQNKLDNYRYQIVESKFFELNKKEYKYLGQKNLSYTLNNIGYGKSNNTDKIYFSYELLIEFEPNKKDDQGTTSLINIEEQDEIKSFVVEEFNLLNNKFPMVKVIIDTNNRHIEALLLPASAGDYFSYYEHAYNLRKDFYSSYIKNLKQTENVITFTLEKIGASGKTQSLVPYTIEKEINGIDISYPVSVF